MPFPRPRAIAAVAALVAVVSGGYLWLRDSSLVRVRDVYVVGLSSTQEREIRSALRSAALDMTTLNVREDQLKVVARRYPSVARLRAEADFPRKLTIEVVERQPVAALDLGGSRVAVGAGGLVMRGMRVGDELPTVKAARLGADGRVEDPRALTIVTVLAAAPPKLRARLERGRWSDRGLLLEMREGPDLVFGGRSRPRAKWAAATRVLADPSSIGATYLDVRVPERVAAGGLGPVEKPQPQPEVPPTLQ